MTETEIEVELHSEGDGKAGSGDENEVIPATQRSPPVESDVEVVGTPRKKAHDSSGTFKDGCLNVAFNMVLEGGWVHTCGFSTGAAL